MCSHDLQLTFVYQFLNYVLGVDINHDQSSESNSRLLGKLASNQSHDIGQLILQLLVVVLHSLRTIADGLVDFLCPVDLVDTDSYLAGPLTYPVHPLSDWVGLRGREGERGREGVEEREGCGWGEGEGEKGGEVEVVQL